MFVSIKAHLVFMALIYLSYNLDPLTLHLPLCKLVVVYLVRLPGDTK